LWYQHATRHSNWELRKNIDEMSKEKRLITLQKAQQFIFIQPQAEIISPINMSL
jgi:hypothetical protein